MSWSIATRFNAGMVAWDWVTGNMWDKKLNHRCWMGAMKKPYAIKRVSLSKSNGAGRLL